MSVKRNSSRKIHSFIHVKAFWLTRKPVPVPATCKNISGFPAAALPVKRKKVFTGRKNSRDFFFLRGWSFVKSQ